IRSKTMPKILLVEDDNNLREIFQMRLQAEGYTTLVAADGEEGLATAMKEKPDLVIADVMMPKLSGFEMVENLRAAPETKQLKVIMMTALGQAEDQARGEKLGVLKYLVKSQVTLEDFARVVKEALGPASPDASAATQSGQISNNNQQESESHMQDDQSTNQTPAPSGDGAPASDGTNPVSGAPAGGGMADTGPQSTGEEAAAVQGQVDQAMGAPVPADPAPADGGTDMPSAPAPGGDQPTTEPPATTPTDPTSNAL
ncbi:MAG TPA: response regulator, partial [Candidatus Saccharimonadales bacterium]|nr:response regulator [Candidatus Saccharimonadales bacterium]